MNCLVKQFAICLGVVVILLFNVSVGGCALSDRPCWIPKNACLVPVIPVCI